MPLELLKKLLPDKEMFTNCQPVSNLVFVSQITEKAGLKQRLGHMDENNLHAPSQSAYRREHSTQTALIKIEK